MNRIKTRINSIRIIGLTGLQHPQHTTPMSEKSHTTKADLKLIRNIARWGGDLDKEHPVEFFMYFPSEHDAVQAEVDMMNLQFFTKVTQNGNEPNWELYAMKSMKVTTERISGMNRWLEQLAGKHRGKYDGWGTVL